MPNLRMRGLEHITSDHIRQAAHQIDIDGVPKSEEARDYEVIVDDRRYPGPRLVREAFELAYGYKSSGPKKNLGPHLALPKLQEIGLSDRSY